MYLIQDTYTYFAIWRERSQWLWLDSRVRVFQKFQRRIITNSVDPFRFNVCTYSSYNYINFKVITVIIINRVYVYHSHCITREKRKMIAFVARIQECTRLESVRSSEGGGILKESLFTTAYIGPKMGKRFGPGNVNAITAAYFAMMTQFMGWRTEQTCSMLWPRSIV